MTSIHTPPAMTWWTRCVLVASAAVAATSVLVAQAPDSKTTTKTKDPRAPYLRLAEPWPDADTMRQRKEEAETRPLYSSYQPLLLVLKADFKAVNKDRTEN